MFERPLLVRADAGPGIGNGHVVRCSALAEEWVRQGGTATLVSAAIPDDLRSQVEHRGIAVRRIEGSAREFALVRSEHEPSWVVIDGYGFGPDVYHAAAPANVAVLDDHGSAGANAADLIVDQNLGATSGPYREAAGSVRLLLGPRYTLLRKEFAGRGRSDGVVAEEVRHLLVTLGGDPPPDVRARVLEAIELAGVDARCTVLGPGAAVDDMAALLASVDLAITASGSIVWELSFLGVPMIVLPVAPNQRPLAVALEAAGAAVAVDGGASASEMAAAVQALVVDRERRAVLAQRASKIVDGLGARRVVAAMRGIDLVVRPASDGDAELLFGWANDDEVRRMSFRNAEISWDEHLRWVRRRLADADTRIVIVSDDVGLIGQFRAERTATEATVGISLDRARRGEHLAPAVIDRCSSELLAHGWATRLHAWIRPDNLASRRSFSIGGYEQVGAGEVGDVAAVHYARD